MFLKDIIEFIKKEAKKIPNVNTVIVGDVLKLNNSDVEYSAIVIAPTAADFDSYEITIFYADKVNDDESNVVDIQSHSVEIIKNIAGRLKNADFDDITEVETDRFELFTQRFNALCAGCFATITVSYDNGDIDCKIY